VRAYALWCGLVRRRIGQNDDQVNWLQDAAGSDGVKARGFVDMQIVMSLSKHARGIGRDWRQGRALTAGVARQTLRRSRGNARAAVWGAPKPSTPIQRVLAAVSACITTEPTSGSSRPRITTMPVT